MTTLADLRTKVSGDLMDPDGKTFDSTAIDSFINSALVEIGKIAPARFQEDIDPVLNTFEYTLRQDVFSGAVPEIELSRVEIWDETQTPHRPVALLRPVAGEYMNYSAAGWACRDGVLEIPYSVVSMIGSDVANYSFRVWGYSPYAPVSASDDVIPVSGEREQALRDYCMVLGLKRLVNERDLFTQWQTRAGNTDVSPASLMNALNIAMADWKARSRSIAVLREAPG